MSVENETNQKDNGERKTVATLRQYVGPIYNVVGSECGNCEHELQ
jgi:hypothetical protein